MSKPPRKNELKVHLWEGEDGQIEGHVDLPPDRGVFIDAMILMIGEFCRTNQWKQGVLLADLQRGESRYPEWQD